MKITRKMREGTEEVSFFDILEQGKWWRTSDATWVRVREMELRHAFFTLALLERKAPDLAVRYAFAPVFFDAPDEVQAELDMMVNNPQRWVRSTELYQSLLQHVTKEAMK
jgi:hypothetical protein